MYHLVKLHIVLPCSPRKKTITQTISFLKECLMMRGNYEQETEKQRVSTTRVLPGPIPSYHYRSTFQFSIRLSLIMEMYAVGNLFGTENFGRGDIYRRMAAKPAAAAKPAMAV